MNEAPKSAAKLSSPQRDRYAVSKLAAAVLAAFCFVGWPVKPPTEVPPSDMHEVMGSPSFREPPAWRMSGATFYVNGVRLNCRLGLLDGLSGCDIFRAAITDGMPVRATYYLMPTRIGIRYPVLYRLEQNGKAVVSPQQTQDCVMRSHEGAWSAYLQLVVLFFSVAMTAGFIDCANASRRDTRVTGEVKPYQED
jgi:hypothetical protein